jgi:HK97 gp10 family phage protein
MAKRNAVQLYVVGSRRIDANLKKLGRKLSAKLIRQAMRKILKPIEKSARQYAPKLTGEMAKGIKIRAAKARKRGTIALQVLTTGPGAYKAVLNEFGTDSQAPVSFMRRSFNEHQRRAKLTLMALLSAAIKKEVAKLHAK